MKKKMLKCLPQLEVRIHHPVGETFTANTDAFKHTVTGQLVHDKMGVNDTGLLQLVGNDTTDEVRLGGSQSGHQVVQLFLVRGGHSRETTSLLTTATAASLAASVTGLTRMVSEDLDQQFVGGFLVLVDDGVVQRVLVLLQPSSDVVWYLSRVRFKG